jgi:hypothetical protein
VVNGRHYGAPKPLGQQEPVPEGLDIVNDVKFLGAEYFPQQGKGPNAEDQHFRKKTESGRGPFKKIQRAKNHPGIWGWEKIPVDAPEV